MPRIMKNLNFISEKVLDIRTQVDTSAGFFNWPVHKDLLNWMQSMDVEYMFGDYLSDVCAQLT